MVGPRSSSGNALLSDDLHLGMTQPATRYLAHLDALEAGGDEHGAVTTGANAERTVALGYVATRS